MSLFIRWKLGTSKINSWGQNLEEAMFVYILKRETGYDSYWLCFFSLCCDNFCTKTDTGDKIKYSRIPKKKEIKQENTKENIKMTTEINWD